MLTKKLFETSTSTIQAGDPSILTQNDNIKLKSSAGMNSNNGASKQAQNDVYFKNYRSSSNGLSALSSTVINNNEIEMKCLNDLILPNSYTDSKKKQQQQHHEDANLRFDNSSKLNYHQSRILHMENDLLPIPNQLQTSSTVLKRHLAASSYNNLKNADSNGNKASINTNKLLSSYNTEYFSASNEVQAKPMQRKIASSASAEPKGILFCFILVFVFSFILNFFFII